MVKKNAKTGSGTDKPKKSGGSRSFDGTGSAAFTQAEFNYVRKKRKPVEEVEMGELNIVPYLDIMVNLIMFLLITQATMVALGVINVTAPTYATAGVSSSTRKDPRTELRLTVGVALDGFYIAAKGGVLGQEVEPEKVEVTPDGVQRATPTVPLGPDGKHNYKALTQKLRTIKTVFPQAQAVYLAADQNIPYDVIVKTLDASRSDTQGELFPAVAFSRLR
jgi:biopolymer transport protein TolR